MEIRSQDTERAAKGFARDLLVVPRGKNVHSKRQHSLHVYTGSREFHNYGTFRQEHS